MSQQRNEVRSSEAPKQQQNKFKIRNFLENMPKPKSDLPDFLPRPPFRFIVAGGSGNGKTNMVANLMCEFLVNPKSKRSIFDSIYIFSSTAQSDPLFAEIARHPTMRALRENDSFDMFINLDLPSKKERDYVFDEYADPQEAEEQMTPFEYLVFRNNRKERRLIFVDDFAYDGRIFLNPVFVKTLQQGRHRNVSIIISTQTFAQIPPIIRDNSTNFAIYQQAEIHYPNIARSIMTPAANNDETINMLVSATMEPFHFLYVDIPQQRYFDSFEKEYATKRRRGGVLFSEVPQDDEDNEEEKLEEPQSS